MEILSPQVLRLLRYPGVMAAVNRAVTAREEVTVTTPEGVFTVRRV